MGGSNGGDPAEESPPPAPGGFVVETSIRLRNRGPSPRSATALDPMKSFLQKYEMQTRWLFAASLGFLGLGIFLYLHGFGLGIVLAFAGGAGLVWCFLRR